MIAVVCLDNRDGTLFHGRRQSQDRALRADLLRECRGRRLWMNRYSAPLFAESEAAVTVDDDCLAKAGEGEFCLAENQPLSPWREKLEGMIVYRWNRAYPADEHLDLLPRAAGLRLSQRVDFPGYSHEKLTREVYVRGPADA